MNEYEFSVRLTGHGIDTNADGFEDRFYEAGCDDALLATTRSGDVITLEFAREAEDEESAIRSAIQDVLNAIPLDRIARPGNGLVLRVGPPS